MKQKGVTLIELLIVIVVMGIVATFSIIQVTKIVSNTRISVDSYNLATLNAVTEKYGDASSSAAADVFSGIATNPERMSVLVSAGYLDGAIRVQQPDASFEWDILNQSWKLIGGDTNDYYSGSSTIYDFTSDTLQAAIDAGALSGDMDEWDTDDGVLTYESYEALLYFPISRLEYTITTTAKLAEGTAYGYGVFFDMTLENGKASKEYGYILQFDRGLGMLVVRHRDKGSESSYTSNWPIGIYNGTSQGLPSKSDPWWTEVHEIKIVVKNESTTQRSASFYIDGNPIGDPFIYDNEIDGQQIYSGFRGWGNIDTQFYSFKAE